MVDFGDNYWTNGKSALKELISQRKTWAFPWESGTPGLL